MPDSPEHSAQQGPPPAVVGAREAGYASGASSLPAARNEPTISGGYRSSPKPDGGYIVNATRLTKNDFFQELMSLDPGERREFERELFIMGFYPGGTNIDAIAGASSVMPDTLVAAERFFNWASAINANEPWQVLSSQTADELAGVAGPGEFGAGGSATVVNLSDPVGLGQVLDRTYKSVVGRAPSDADKRAFVAAMHQMQRSQQMSIATARAEAQSGAIDVEGVDVGAQAEAFTEQQAPVEAEAFQAVQQTDVLRNLTQRGPGA